MSAIVSVTLNPIKSETALCGKDLSLFFAFGHIHTIEL